MTFVLDSSVTLAWVFEDEGADAGGDPAPDSLLTSLLREDARVPALWPRQGSRGAGGLTAGTSVRCTACYPPPPWIATASQAIMTMHTAQSPEREAKMTVLTIRGVDDELSEALRREAKLRGVSMNTLTRELLRRGLGLGGGPQRHHELDALAGAWSPADLDAFTEATALFGAIDPSLWE